MSGLNIILIGFRGTGKTTIGKIIARRLGKEFIDADEYLERKEGKSIRDIFTEGGEEMFRKIETRVIAELCLLDNRIIATGGGAVIKDENVKNLKRHGIVILLEADADTLYKRIGGDVNTQQKRPNLTNLGAYQEIEYLLAYRMPFYDRAADFVINTSNISANDAANRILSLIHNHAMDLKNHN